MKRLLTIGLMLASAFALTNCSEQLVTPNHESEIVVDGTVDNELAKEEMLGTPYEVLISDPVTKTISDGINTYWIDEATAKANGMGLEDVDRATIYSVNSENEITCHGKFAYAGNQRFVGNHYGDLTDGTDWYCVYPYISSEAADNLTGISETLVIGAAESDNFTQTQLVLNSKSHIAGNRYPLFGVVNDVSATQTPRFTNVTPVSALLALNIVNEGDSGVFIEKFELESEQYPIAGEFQVDFTNGTPSVSSALTSNNSKIATLSLSDTETGSGLMVSGKSSGKFYLALAPVNDKFTIRINGTAITNEQAIPLESGKVTTLRITIPNLHGTQTTSTSKDGTNFVKWNKKTDSKAIVNGHTDVHVYEVNDGSITISGPLGNFLGKDRNNSVLPLSFYAASKIKTGQEGNYINVPAGLEVALVKLYSHVIVDLALFKIDKEIDLSFSGEDLSRKMNGMRVGFDLSPVGSFDKNQYNIILFDEAVNYYYIDENKADYLMGAANIYIEESDGSKNLFKVQDFRDAIFNGSLSAWKKVYKLVEKLAPGQFAENNAEKDADGNVIKEGKDSSLVQLLDILVAESTSDKARAAVGNIIKTAVITIDLQTTGDAVCWGLNVQSPDSDLPKAN